MLEGLDFGWWMVAFLAIFFSAPITPIILITMATYPNLARTLKGKLIWFVSLLTSKRTGSSKE